MKKTPCQGFYGLLPRLDVFLEIISESAQRKSLPGKPLLPQKKHFCKRHSRPETMRLSLEMLDIARRSEQHSIDRLGLAVHKDILDCNNAICQVRVAWQLQPSDQSIQAGELGTGGKSHRSVREHGKENEPKGKPSQLRQCMAPSLLRLGIQAPCGWFLLALTKCLMATSESSQSRILVVLCQGMPQLRCH